MKETVLNLIKSNSFYTERALEAICKEKIFIVADLHKNKIASFNRTIYGAESFVKSRTDDYIYFSDWNVSEIINVVSPLQIFEFSAFDINGYKEELSA